LWSFLIQRSSIFQINTIMNRLPKVLQNEIFEYIHGDRFHWKAEFTFVLFELVHSMLNTAWYGHRPGIFSTAKCLREGSINLHNPTDGNFRVALNRANKTWEVCKYERVECVCWAMASKSSYSCLADAQRQYHRLSAEIVKDAFHWYRLKGRTILIN
jgi:hypothetical protein